MTCGDGGETPVRPAIDRHPACALPRRAHVALRSDRGAEWLATTAVRHARERLRLRGWLEIDHQPGTRPGRLGRHAHQRVGGGRDADVPGDPRWPRRRGGVLRSGVHRVASRERQRANAHVHRRVTGQAHSPLVRAGGELIVKKRENMLDFDYQEHTFRVTVGADGEFWTEWEGDSIHAVSYSLLKKKVAEKVQP